MARWIPTQEECNLIRSIAKRITGCGRPKLEAGIRCDHDANENVNHAFFADDVETDLSDFMPWAQFRKGVELTDKGVAVIDFYVYDTYELNTNLEVMYVCGKVQTIKSVMGSIYYDALFND